MPFKDRLGSYPVVAGLTVTSDNGNRRVQDYRITTGA